MKIITRIKGGLGNQLFCYAAARRLALKNNAELVIDNVTGFSRDKQYHRKYALDHFQIPCRVATFSERLEPFERYRRGLMKWVSHKKPFMERHYIEQEGINFDERLLSLKIRHRCLYLDGLWQSEHYFKDVAKTIRDDLRIIPPEDFLNSNMSGLILSSNAVALHVRWFNTPNSTASHNLSVDYYRRAIALMEKSLSSPHYFLFSDEPEAAQSLLELESNKVTLVSHNHGDENAYADLWLMSQCKHFITANSTFSWWGAWLGSSKNSIVLTPNVKFLQQDGVMAWGFDGLIPDDWIQI